MAISQNPTLKSTKYDIIKAAFAKLNLYAASESISAEDFEYASDELNRMIDSWMADGYHLWLKQTGYLFVQKNQNLYSISSTSTDHATLNYFTTALKNDVSQGSNFIVVTDPSNIAVNDYIGVILNDNSMFWSTVDTIAADQINFPAGVGISGDSRAGNNVRNYTKKIDNPLNIYSAVRNDDGVTDIPLNYLSYEEYFEQPNKNITGIPNSYNYDRQLNEAVIKLWPVPDNANSIIKFILSRNIYKFDDNSDDADFPSKWHRAIVWNLAVELAPAFGKNKDVGYTNLVQLANLYLNQAESFDNELGSLYIKPNFSR